MPVWEGIVPSIKNSAYTFNKYQDNPIEYADASYIFQLFASAYKAITNILKEELHKKDQIKSALVAYATYIKYTYKGSGDTKKLKPYLDIIKLDRIPMSTSICSCIFNKIEKMNPDISINVWKWKEETATPKSVIASKNYNRQHIIYLMALTDITKFEEENFQTEKSLAYHQEHCFGLEEAIQKVKLPTKNINDFEKFKNYRPIINTSCIIITKNINTGDIWEPFLYRRENAIQEFV
ncbi:22089_t:CDS:2 [Cetraspora pellucida]|uniref:22089_t:CDS:1 n=1 Tax=Cetraspora pellucida TaxID=1433469 RepID=A0A9N9A4B6_9GLOM|nr:22089_t:CDS:2 [Cetraspora pellucida]